MWNTTSLRIEPMSSQVIVSKRPGDARLEFAETRVGKTLHAPFKRALGWFLD